MMVRFELARPTSPSSTSTSSTSRLILQPSRILHPRFEDRLSRLGSTGKAMWVTCWADAVAVLAQKGASRPPRARLPLSLLHRLTHARSLQARTSASTRPP